ncbi:unnamed protein product [Boreogadus saida]
MVPIPDAVRVLRTQLRCAVHSVDTTILGSPVTRPPRGPDITGPEEPGVPQRTPRGEGFVGSSTHGPQTCSPRRDGGVSTARGRGAGKRAARAKGNSGGPCTAGLPGLGACSGMFCVCSGLLGRRRQHTRVQSPKRPASVKPSGLRLEV